MRWGAAFGLFSFVTLAPSGFPARAAEIDTVKISEEGDLQDLFLIRIIGEISQGDEEKFRRISVQYDQAVVGLESEGGALLPAIEIGKLIRIKEYPTLVVKDSVCTSSCALIWVAGSQRFLAPTGRVGFHASYLDVDGRQHETGLGNALVGRYLTLLNLPEKAVIFATAASPNDILWLDSANMREAGIEFETFGDPQPPAIVTTPISPTARSTSGWVHVATGGKTKYYLDRSRIYRTGRYLAAWELADEKENHEVGHSESKNLYYFDCSMRRMALRQYMEYDDDGKILTDYEWKDHELDWDSVVPDSVGETKLNFVCRAGL